jgi:hypothetical protein
VGVTELKCKNIPTLEGEKYRRLSQVTNLTEIY